LQTQNYCYSLPPSLLPPRAVIPPDFVQTLLARVDIVDLIGRYVPLKKSGANCMGLCPFHGEKTPSFSVSPVKQMYYCFGCGAHGDAVKFLMEFMGSKFVDAVQDLAQQAGMPVPQDNRTVQERAQAVQAKAHQASLSDFLAQAGEHYRAQLQAAPNALAYLEKRGLSADIMAQFGLGYAPAGWRNLAASTGEYDDARWVDCGLVITQGAPETPEYKRYDRFRDRIMFPIRSVQGEVIGFGGRVLEQAEPKYLNSPETAVFVKGRELYGLHEARAGLRKHGYALVVEGYMDVVALAQSGLDNAVATLGTACSGEHIQKLFRFTESIVFSFDGDAAGRRAAARALQVSLPYASDTRSIKFLFLPPEHDPDSYVRALGKAAFQDCVEKAAPLSRQLIAQAREGCDTLSAEGRAKLLSHARPLWNALPAGVLKMQMLSELAHAAALSNADLSHLWQSPQDGLTGPASTPTAHHQRGLTSKRTPRMFARAAPAGLIDAALRMLLLHSAWWEQLAPTLRPPLHLVRARPARARPSVLGRTQPRFAKYPLGRAGPAPGSAQRTGRHHAPSGPAPRPRQHVGSAAQNSARTADLASGPRPQRTGPVARSRYAAQSTFGRVGSESFPVQSRALRAHRVSQGHKADRFTVASEQSLR
jgi:DNA primase